MWRVHDSDYSLSRHIIPFMQDCAFYAEISRHVGKRCSRDLGTAAISFDPKADELIFWYNDCFFGGGTYTAKDGTAVEEEGLTNWETRGVITHEFDHIVYGHLNERRHEPSDIDNIGKDLANNWVIMQKQGQPKDLKPGETARKLPRCALIPGVRPWADPKKMTALSPAHKKAVEHLSDLIESFPGDKASEWYFNRLMTDQKKHPDMYPKEALLVIRPLDDHEGWSGDGEGEGSGVDYAYVQGKIKAIIEKAVRHADSHANGWGTIPAEMQAEIRRSVSTVVNWRQVLRQFIGSVTRGHRATSIKRINRRYPYVHPGVKKGYTAKLIIAIDESGSVGDDMLEMFFAELETLTRKVDITLLHFDCHTSVKDMYEWKKGTRPQLKRVRGGGTNFDAPTDFVISPENRGRWDGLLIMTDGCAPAPGPSRIKRGWVLGQGCNLLFPSDEIQVFLTSETEVKGAWR